MPARATDAAGDQDAEAIALAFGATIHALRLRAGISLNELARRAGVDPAYVHRMEARGTQRPPLPRRPVVLALAAAFGSDARQADQLLALAGHAPAALLELGGWDNTLASVAELLADPSLSGPAKAEFREVVLILARRWARAETASPAATLAPRATVPAPSPTGRESSAAIPDNEAELPVQM